MASNNLLDAVVRHLVQKALKAPNLSDKEREDYVANRLNGKVKERLVIQLPKGVVRGEVGSS